MTEYEYFGSLKRLNKLQELAAKSPREIQRIGNELRCFRYPGDFFVKIPCHYTYESFPSYEERTLSNSQVLNELLVNLMLFKRGYPVIEPFGIFEVTVPRVLLNRKKDISVPAFVTRYKEGTSYREDGKMERIINRARKEGFEPGFDAGWGKNGLWVPSENKLYLVDFEEWQGNQKEKDKLVRSLGFN